MTSTVPPLPPPFALYRMATGYYLSRALHAAAALGLVDVLAGAPRDHRELAEATGTHAPSLRRLLRLLASAGVLSEEADGRFALTVMGEYLRAGTPGSMRAAVLLFGGTTQDVWGDLLHSVRTGEPAFAHRFGVDSFTYMAQHPEEAANFDAAMADFTRQIAAAVAAAYDFSTLGTVVDVGGGNGALLAGILRATTQAMPQAAPGPRGIVFDLPHVAERARAHLEAVGLAARCGVAGGDFFRAVPAGADAYLLKHVLHDWDDARAADILRACRRAMGPGGRVLIVEGIYPARIDQSDASRGAAANDVNMLVCTGGRQRSEAEFGALLTAAGFALVQIVPTPARISIIEGTPT